MLPDQTYGKLLLCMGEELWPPLLLPPHIFQCSSPNQHACMTHLVRDGDAEPAEVHAAGDSRLEEARQVAHEEGHVDAVDPGGLEHGIVDQGSLAAQKRWERKKAC